MHKGGELRELHTMQVAEEDHRAVDAAAGGAFRKERRGDLDWGMANMRAVRGYFREHKQGEGLLLAD